MRQWLCTPEILCRKHLFGEHVETHMFIGSIDKGISMQGYITNDLLQPLSLKSRHNSLVEEMLRRGYKHHSPFMSDVEYFKILSKLPNLHLNHIVNQQKILSLLLQRCEKCRKRYNEMTF